MKVKPKIIFFDIDWTLYDHSKDSFDFEALKDINSLQEKGYLIVLVTDRSYQSLKDLGTLEYIKPDGFITSGGASIIYQDKIIREYSFTLEESKEIIALLLPLNKSVMLTTSNDAFMLNEVKEEVHILYSYYKEVVPPKREYQDEDITMFTLFSDDTNDSYIKENLPQGTKFYRFDPYGLDLIPKDHSKGDAVKELLNYLHIDKKDSLSFGDNDPDISMFKESGYSVCLSNGSIAAKKAASLVTKSVSDSGVSFSLRKLKLLK